MKMEKLLIKINQFRKEQSELHEWTKKNGHPMTANYTEGGLDTCDNIIAIIEGAMAETSHENSGLDIDNVKINISADNEVVIIRNDGDEWFVSNLVALVTSELALVRKGKTEKVDRKMLIGWVVEHL